MSTISASFVSLSGTQYKVYIGGGTIPAKDITLAGDSPVKISIAQADCKFAGLRTVNATIRLVAYEDMSWLYANGAKEIAVGIVKVTSSGSESTIFDGYLVPFNYDQPYQLNGDVIELTAVDALTANKYRIYDGTWLYARRENGNIMSAMTWIMEMMIACGLNKTVYVHENFGNAKTFKHNLETVMISPLAFLPSDWYHEEAKLSCPEIISQIAQFFGYTAIYYNNALYLYDVHAMANMAVFQKTTVYTYNADAAIRYTRVNDISVQNSQGNPYYNIKVITADSFEAANAKMSIEQGYDEVQITPADTSQEILVPDVLQSDDETETQWKSGGYAGTWDEWIITALDNADMDCKAYSRNGVQMWQDSIITNKTLEWSGVIPINVSYCNIKKFNGVRNQKMLWYHRYPMNTGVTVTAPTLAALFGDNIPYYDGRKFRISMSAMYSVYNANNNASSWRPPFDDTGKSKSGVGPYAFPNLYIYAKDTDNVKWYYQSSTTAADDIHTTWNQGENIAPMKMGDSSTHGELALLNSRNAVNWRKSGWLGQGAPGAFNIEIFPGSLSPSDTRYDAWIMGFSIEIAEKDYSAKDTLYTLHTLQNGVSIERLGISCGLVSNYGHNMHAMVLADTWSGTYMGTNTVDEAMGKCGVLTNQACARYQHQHKAYQFTIGIDVQPWSRVKYQNNAYTVDAMDWDLKDDKKTITIN